MQRRTLRRTLRRTQRTTHREEEAKVKGEEEDKRETSLNPMRERTEKNRSRFHFDFVLGFLSSILSIYPSFIILSFCCRTPSSPFLTWWFFSFHWSSFCSHNKTFSFSFLDPSFHSKSQWFKEHLLHSLLTKETVLGSKVLQSLRQSLSSKKDLRLLQRLLKMLQMLRKDEEEVDWMKETCDGHEEPIVQLHEPWLLP